MPNLFQVLQSSAAAEPTHEVPLGCQAIPLHLLWQGLQRHLRSQAAHSNSHRWIWLFATLREIRLKPQYTVFSYYPEIDCVKGPVENALPFLVIYLRIKPDNWHWLSMEGRMMLEATERERESEEGTKNEMVEQSVWE